MKIEAGMEVFGIFRNAAGYFRACGKVTDVTDKEFTAEYKILAQPIKYDKSALGVNVFTDEELATKRAEKMENRRWQQAREDFAEQNSLLGNI